jgi:hypothetical protein
MIQLTQSEIKWIKLCKNHYYDTRTPINPGWIGMMQDMFEEIYGWSPYEFRADFLSCIFNQLLDIWLKISNDQSGTNRQLHSIFSAAFSKSISREEESSVERAILELRSLIAFTSVIDENNNKRFEL